MTDRSITDHIGSLTALSAFVVWAAEDDALYGGIRAQEALRALARVMGVSVAALRAAILQPASVLAGAHTGAQGAEAEALQDQADGGVGAVDAG